MNLRHIALFGSLVLALIPCRPAGAQELGTELEQQQMRNMLAHEFVRRSTISLRSIRHPTRESFALAAARLDLAAALAEDDPDLLRLLIESAEWAEDRDLVMDGTRRLVRQDPTDLVAQLRLFDDRVRTTQNSEERLQAYEHLLGPAGKKLHDTVRSRLAYDAAILAREAGDLDRFTELLSQAVTLDSTNKPAAALSVAFHASRRPDQPAEHLELLLNLLHADPMDPATPTTIARHLLKHGAYEQAGRFIDAGIGLLGTGSTELSDTVFMIRVLAIWARGADDEALAALDIFQTVTSRAERDRRLLALDEENQRKARFGEPYTPIDWSNPPFQDLLLDLPVSLQWLRAMIAEATGREAMADVAAEKVISAIDEFVVTARVSLEEMEAIEGVTPAFKRAQVDTAQSDLTSLLGESILARVLFNHSLDEAPALLEEYLADEGVRPVARQRFQGWLLFRQGRLDEARSLLEQAGDDPLSQLGLALMAQEAGDTRQAVRLCAAVWKAQPETQIGLFAKSSLEQLLGRPAPALSEVALELGRLAAQGVGDDLLNLWRDPSRVVQLRLEPVRNEIQYLEQPLMRVTLRNASNYPLALGPESPLSTRLMVVAAIKLDGRYIQAMFLPVILDLHRRFRLDPRQEITIEANLVRDQHVEFAWATPGTNVQLAYRGILDFSPAEAGQYIAGPMGTEARADPIISFGVVGALRDPTGVMLNFDKAWGYQRMALLGIAVTTIGTPDGRQIDPVSPETKATMQEGLLERFDRLTDLERAWVLLRGAGMTRLAKDSPIVLRAMMYGGELTTLSYLLTHVDTLDDPVLAAALEDDSETVRSLAQAQRAALLAEAEAAEAGGETPTP
jgi:tetratricopeptide (TPR) repeat protein